MEEIDTHDQVMLNLIRSATFAPSSHNTQPWYFRVSPSTIELYADRTRALPVNDPHDRELTISCGCALFNLRAEAARQGITTHTEIFPASDDPDMLARIVIGQGDNISEEEAALASYIEQRRTLRKDFAEREVSAKSIQQMMDAASHEDAWLEPLADAPRRHKAADLVAEGDAAQWSNPSWRRELALWMHSRRRGDGLTVSTAIRPMTQLIVRTFDMGRGVGAKDRQLAEGSPVLAILGTDRDGSADWLRAGQALQRVLLVACQHGLQASYLNQPIQVAALRTQLQTLSGRGYPQILLRMGYPNGDVPAAPRRPIDDVIEFRHEA